MRVLDVSASENVSDQNIFLKNRKNVIFNEVYKIDIFIYCCKNLL